MPPGVEADRQSGSDFTGIATTIGVVAVGVALFEAALVPGIVIGGAAILAPKLLPGLGIRLPRLFAAATSRPAAAAPAARPVATAAKEAVARFGVKQAVVKTITFRLIVTTLDFTTNYIVLGEAGTAAGLSAIGVVAGPVFYFVHEAAWNYFGASAKRSSGQWGTSIEIPFLPAFAPGPADAAGDRQGLRINQSLAKTITFRTFATVMDFTTTYLVVGDPVTALTLSTIGFVVGPFVYIGHEMAWDRWGTVREPTATPTPIGLLPAPAAA